MITEIKFLRNLLQSPKRSLSFVLIVLFLSSCNTPTKVVEGVGNTTEQPQNSDGTDATKVSEEAEVKDPAEETIVREASKTSRKGTNIRAIVNGEPITNYDIKRRVAFMKLRRIKGNRNELALKEMVEQAIKLQEAKRNRSLASDKEVENSFAGFAKSNRMSVKQMAQVLNQAGVGSDHFKKYIQSQMSWPRVVGAKFRSETTNKTEQVALAEIRQKGEEKPQTTEYKLQQIVFVIPADKKKEQLKQRRTEALSFKQKFSSCDETPKMAVGLRDVSVLSIPRTLEPRLPPEWREELKDTLEGQTTGIINSDKGVEFLAVCSLRVVSDDNAVKVVSQSKDFESFNEKGDEYAEGFLKELKSKAKVIYR